ncbi:hypothetical protein [Sphingobium agri]|uniref:Uncharacterized protein n=1 Tax=Sphingobium agri TaxID=2933566 RepID=A0ABT0DXB1_9SPHN|nr:hypothetical protein [Sphingobium agri]MCK0531767.1 hypothetical protein [Sphingobium agri]
MKLRAKDSLHISAVGPDAIRPGQEFSLNDGDAKSLIARGLAEEVAEKAEGPLSNKKEGASPSTKTKKAE